MRALVGLLLLALPSVAAAQPCTFACGGAVATSAGPISPQEKATIVPELPMTPTRQQHELCVSLYHSPGQGNDGKPLPPIYEQPAGAGCSTSEQQWSTSPDKAAWDAYQQARIGAGRAGK